MLKKNFKNFEKREFFKKNIKENKKRKRSPIVNNYCMLKWKSDCNDYYPRFQRISSVKKMI